MAKKKVSRKKTSKKRAVNASASGGVEAPVTKVDVGGWDRILGQHRAVGTLQRALSSGRAHHAWIFHGPRGVGKFTTAVTLAATLLDPRASADLAGVLSHEDGGETARLMSAGSHPDFHVVTKDLAAFSRDAAIRSRKRTTIPVEVLREFLIEPASRTASGEGGGLASKVVILDEAHLLQAAGQNVLLKTLEEPPVGTVLILVTTSEERLLPTVRSRCQRVVFRPLDDRAMDAWLSRQDESVRGELGPLVEIADGSPGEAVRLARLGATGWVSSLGEGLRALEAGRGDPALAGLIAKLASEAAERDVEGDKHASKDAANKQATGELIRYIASWADRRMRAAATRDPSDVGRWADAAEGLRDAETALYSNVQLALVATRIVTALEDALIGAPASR